MTSNEEIIYDVIKKYSSILDSSTIISLVKHVLKVCKVDENICDDDDIKNIFKSYYNVNGRHRNYGKKGWEDKSSEKKRRNDLYHLFFMIWVSYEGEYFSIQEKLTRKVCFILKEVLKPDCLVPDNSQSLFTKRKRHEEPYSQLRGSQEVYFDYDYYIPKPFSKNYGGPMQYHDLAVYDEKTKQIRDHRDQMIIRREQEFRREEQRKQRTLNPPPPPKVNKTMDWRTISKNDNERTQKLQPVVSKKYVPPQRPQQRYNTSQRRRYN